VVFRLGPARFAIEGAPTAGGAFPIRIVMDQSVGPEGNGGRTSPLQDAVAADQPQEPLRRTAGFGSQTSDLYHFCIFCAGKLACLVYLILKCAPLS
jgi:hypothetical protein